MKKLPKWFKLLAIYFGIGFLLMNIFSLSRYSSNISEMGLDLVIRNILNPNFWLLTIIWPYYLAVGLAGIFFQ